MTQTLSDFLPSEVLLHSCCAPCSAAILEWMTDRGIRPTIFFYNPNIYPLEEYLTRKNEIDRYAKSLNLKIIDGDYRHDLWRISVRGLEDEPERGKRCLACFSHRLLVTAECARKEGIKYFTTTLAGSRWKRLEQIQEAAQKAGSLVPGVCYWDVNWKKGGLQERRAVLLKEHQFYNQQYCGCEFSMRHLSEMPRKVSIESLSQKGGTNEEELFGVPDALKLSPEG